MQADLAVIETDLDSVEFTWKSENYLCSPASVNQTNDLGIGGFGENISKVLVVRKNAFTDSLYPASKEFVTYDGKEYRIATVVENANKAFLRLLLVDDNQGV